MIDLDNCQKLNEDYVLSDFILDILPSDPIEKAKKYKKILINDLIKRNFNNDTINNYFVAINNYEEFKDYIDNFIRTR